MKLTLKSSVTAGEVTVTELKFREEIVAGDLRGIKLKHLEDVPTDDLLKIAGRLCGQPDAIMNRLSMEDFASVLEIVGGFFGEAKSATAGPTTPTAA